MTHDPGMSRDPGSASDFPTCADCRAMGFAVSGTLAALEADLGHDVLIAFLTAHGGRVAEIPIRAAVAPCGDPVARAKDWLRREIGHGRWDVPLGPMAGNAQRAWAILTRLRSGASLAGIAAEIGCTTRNVSRQKTIFTRRGLLPAPGSTAKGSDR